METKSQINADVIVQKKKKPIFIIEEDNELKINDPNSEIYKIALERTNYIEIDKKLAKTRQKCLNDNLKLIGTKNDILSHLKCGPAKNIINSFFNFKTDKCDNCSIQKSKIIQLDRAHCNKQNCDRASLLKLSIEKHFIHETPIYIKDILRTFIKLHSEIPLFILCKKCHQKYDKN